MPQIEKNNPELTQYRRYRPKYPGLIFTFHILTTVVVCCIFIGCLWFFYQSLQSAPASNIVVARSEGQQIISTNLVTADPVQHAIKPDIAAKTTQVQQWDWILEQNGNHYIIQLGSSINKEKLYESAVNFDTEAPVAFYPFRLNRDEKIVYGYALGIYNSFDSAKEAVASLPQRVQNFGPWIRPIDDLQRQIASTSRKL